MGGNGNISRTTFTHCVSPPGGSQVSSTGHGARLLHADHRIPEVERSATVRVKTVIEREARSSNAEKMSLLSQMTDLGFGGIQARGALMGIGVLVESSP